MKPSGETIEEILSNLPIDRKEAFNKLYETIVKIFLKASRWEEAMED
jgi:hypothetical protein